MSVFHLPKTSANSGWDVNGTRHFGSFHWKFSGINGISEKVLHFYRYKLSNGKFVFHLQIFRLYCFYHQFHTFRVLLTSQASLGSLEWHLWQKGNAIPKRKFPIGIYPKCSCKWKTPNESHRPRRLSVSFLYVMPWKISTVMCEKEGPCWFCQFRPIHLFYFCSIRTWRRIRGTEHVAENKRQYEDRNGDQNNVHNEHNQG